MKNYIALDVGGSFIKYGILEETGRILVKGSSPTQADGGGEQVFSNIRTIVQDLLAQGISIAGIGIATSGMIDRKGCVLKGAPHFPGWAGIELGPRLESEFRLAVKVGNDVNAMALAEHYFGGAKDLENFVFLAIGTGIGAGLFFHGKLYLGSRGAGGEVGSLRAQRDFISFWEKEASTIAFIEEARKKTGEETLRGAEIFQRYRRGDAQAISLVRRWVEELVKGVADVIVLTDPQKIFFGGAIASEAEIFLPLLEEYRDHYVLHNFHVPFQASQLKEEVGLLGALALLKQEERQRS